MKELLSAILKMQQEMKNLQLQVKRSLSPTNRLKEQWIDGQEVMQLLHISKRTLQSLRDTKALPYSRIKGKFYYKVADVLAILETNYKS